MPNSLIFVGRSKDSSATFVDIDLDAADPRERARVLLEEHRSCDWVEVWRDETCVARLARRSMERQA